MEKCHDATKQTCSFTYKKECKTFPKTVQVPEAYNHCVTKTRPNCFQVPDKKCKSEYVVTGVEKVPFEKCETKCKQVPKEKCEKVSKEVCNPVTVQMPIVFPEEVCEERAVSASHKEEANKYEDIIAAAIKAEEKKQPEAKESETEEKSEVDPFDYLFGQDEVEEEEDFPIY